MLTAYEQWGDERVCMVPSLVFVFWNSDTREAFDGLVQVLLGDMGAGKSSLVLRFVKGQFTDFQVCISMHNQHRASPHEALGRCCDHCL